MNSYGYISDEDKSLSTSGNFATFGLNVATVKKVAFNPNGGNDANNPQNTFEFFVNINDKEFRLYVAEFPLLYDNNGSLLNPNTKEYQEKFEKTELSQQKAVLIHVIKGLGVPSSKIEDALKVPAKNFADFCKILLALVETNPIDKKIHVFLQYQWSIAQGQDRTYLELPKNMKGGRFISPLLPGIWKEDKVDGELKYVNEHGEIHPFIRSKNFLESNKGKQQVTSTITKIEESGAGW